MARTKVPPRLLRSFFFFAAFCDVYYLFAVVHLYAASTLYGLSGSSLQDISEALGTVVRILNNTKSLPGTNTSQNIAEIPSRPVWRERNVSLPPRYFLGKGIFPFILSRFYFPFFEKENESLSC